MLQRGQMLRRLLLLLMMQSALAGCGTVHTLRPDEAAQQVGQTSLPATKIVLVILENSYPEAVFLKRLPFLLRLRREGAFLSNYYSVAHPSQPNYVALVSGSTEGVVGDFPARLNRAHIGRNVSSWKVYAEGYPTGSCDLRYSIGSYTRRHVPFLSFADVQDNADYCREHIVGFEEFEKEARLGNLPNFSLVIPDLDNDAHDQPLARADAWLHQRFSALLNDPNFSRDVTLIVTFDESGEPWPYIQGAPNRVFTVFWGSRIARRDVTGFYGHYDLFRTIAAVLKVAPSITEDPNARVIDEVWR